MKNSIESIQGSEGPRLTPKGEIARGGMGVIYEVRDEVLNLLGHGLEGGEGGDRGGRESVSSESSTGKSGKSKTPALDSFVRGLHPFAELAHDDPSDVDV